MLPYNLTVPQVSNETIECRNEQLQKYPSIALSFVTNHTISLHHYMYPLCACSQLDHLSMAYPY